MFRIFILWKIWQILFQIILIFNFWEYIFDSKLGVSWNLKLTNLINSRCLNCQINNDLLLIYLLQTNPSWSWLDIFWKLEDNYGLSLSCFDLIFKQSLVSLEYRSSADLNFDSKSCGEMVLCCSVLMLINDKTIAIFKLQMDVLIFWCFSNQNKKCHVCSVKPYLVWTLNKTSENSRMIWLFTIRFY